MMLPSEQINLAGRAKRWTKALADSCTGPLVVAQEVVDVADHWDQYQDEAEGISAQQWCRRNLGQNVAWFAARAEAVRRIGEHARRCWHHEAAVWAIRFDDIALRKLHVGVNSEWTENGKHPPTLKSVRRIARALKLTGPVRSKAGCEECQVKDQRIAKLEKWIRQAGVSLPE